MSSQFVLDRDSMTAAWRLHLGVKPTFWTCPCGCASFLAYGRAPAPARILWVMSGTANQREEAVPIMGLEHEGDLKKVALQLRSSGLPEMAIRNVVAVLRPHVPGARGGDA